MKILMAGEGGQGVQVVAEILAKAAFAEGQHVLYIPNFGVEQRGGVSVAFVVIDKNPVVYPKFETADILAIFSNRSLERVKNYRGQETKVILGPAVTAVSSKKIPGVPIQIHSRSELGMPPRVWNMLVLGKVNKVGKIVSQKSLIKAMNDRFAKQFAKEPELKKLNLEALVK